MTKIDEVYSLPGHRTFSQSLVSKVKQNQDQISGLQKGKQRNKDSGSKVTNLRLWQALLERNPCGQHIST